MIDHLLDVLEGFTTLTYMSALNPKFKFGHTVLCQSFRNPALVAKMGATLQYLSGGRFILGMGAGWYADWWNVSSTGVEAYRRLVHEFERACQEVGRDPVQVRRSWGGGCICTPTQQAVAAIAGDRYNAQNADDDFDFVGTPEQIIEQMRPFIKLGVDYFMLDCGGFPNLTTLELLVSEVLPAIND